MAIDYNTSAGLMQDGVFRGRIQVACLHFAAYVMDEPTSTAAHTSRLRWAQNAYQNPTGVAAQVQPPTVMHDLVQAQGSAISDTDLQTAVEATIQTFL